MRIFALARGGLAVFGGHYDPHADEAVVQVREGETVALTVEYVDVPSSMTASGSGITSTTPTVAGAQAALALSELRGGGYLDIEATVGGAVRKIRVRANSDTALDGYDSAGVA